MPSVKRRNGLYGRVPADGVFVGRPSRWGNPWKVGEDGTRDEVIGRYRVALIAGELRVTADDVRRDLRGLDLYCYCAPEPCHANVLLEIASGGH